MRAGSHAGGSVSPCCSANSAAPTRCGRFAGGLRSSEGTLEHLGIAAPSRSTLAYANEHRPWQLYRAAFEALLLRCQLLAKGRRKFRFENKLVSLDSTVIDLCATLFDRAQFRRTTHRALWAWLDRPFEGPPTLLVAAQQEELALA